MSWILIAALVLLAAFGPLLWFKPSAKDKRLNALRARARALDLAVDIKPLLSLNPTPEQRVSASGATRDRSELLAVYSLILPKRLQRLSGFLLHRAPGPEAPPMTRSAVAVEPGWYFDPEQHYPPTLGWPQSWELLQQAAGELPADVRALTVEPRSIGIYWAESAANKVDAVDQLAQRLRTMAADLAALDEQLKAAASEDDS